MIFNLLTKNLRLTIQTNKSAENILEHHENIYNRIITIVPQNPCDKYIKDFNKCMSLNNSNNNCINHIINYIKCKIEEFN